MKIQLTCLIILLFACSTCLAQSQHTLRIVAFRGNVTLDGKKVDATRLIPQSAKKIEIEKGSYAYVLTPKGYAMKLNPGKYRIGILQGFIYKARYEQPRFFAAAVQSTPCPIKYPGFKNARSLMMKDSLFLRWRKVDYSGNHVNPPYGIKIKTMFDDLLYETTTSASYLKLDMRSIVRKEQGILIEVAPNECGTFMLQIINDQETAQVMQDLQSIDADDPAGEIFKLLVMDCNKLDANAIFQLDKIRNIDASAAEEDVRNYFSGIKEKYELNSN